MKNFRYLLPALIIAAATQGCVSSKQYAALQSSYNRSVDTNRDIKQSWLVTQQELSGSRNEVKNLQDQLAANRASADALIASAKANNATLQDALNKCMAGSSQGNVNIAKLADQISASDKYIQHLVELKKKTRLAKPGIDN